MMSIGWWWPESSEPRSPAPIRALISVSRSGEKRRVASNDGYLNVFRAAHYLSIRSTEPLEKTAAMIVSEIHGLKRLDTVERLRRSTVGRQASWSHRCQRRRSPNYRNPMLACTGSEPPSSASCPAQPPRG